MKAKISYGVFLLLTIIIYFMTNVTASFFLMFISLIFPIILFIINKYVSDKIEVNVEVKNVSKDVGTKISFNNGIEIVIKCTNKAIFPIYKFKITGRLNNCFTFSKFTWDKSISIPAKKTKEFSETIESVYCGKIEEYFEEATVYDFFGLSRRKIKLGIRKSQYIFPEYEESFDDYENLFSEDDLNIQDKHIGKKGNDIMEILNLREYTRGDNIKNIHWKLSKKIGKKIVKELDTPAQQEVVILAMLSEENIKEPLKKDRIVRKINGISKDLLTVQVYHDIILFDEKVGYADCVQVENEIGKDKCIQKILDGGVTFEKWLVDEYVIKENILTKYAKIIIVTDEKKDVLYNRYENIETVLI